MAGRALADRDSSTILFARGVLARLQTWPTLRLAVQESWGGPNATEKRTWLASVLVDAFEEQADTLDDQYIEEILLQVMSDEFDTQVEDGSAESVALDVVNMWEETREAKEELVMKFEEMAERLKGRKMDVPVAEEEEEWEDEDEDEDEEMQVDEIAPPLIDRSRRNEPEIDQDGFTMVKGKSRR
ncbi:hypothetical protein BDZ89DRAFT_1140209 [Hymenopellis radicata]|nr:hypothetical protein BDZ89DRAFT_1140209 [Hymenopellis radicata]